MMRIVHANFVRPRNCEDPDVLLDEWRTLIDVAAAVAEAGAEVTLVQSFSRDALISRRGVKCHFVAEPALPGFATGMTPWRLARAALHVRPDVIHVNGLDFPAHTRAMCATGIPVVAQDHASRPGGRRWQRRWGLRRIAGIVFTDAEQAQPFIEDGSLGSDKRVFSVPESSTRFTPGDQADARSATGVYGDPAVLWIGRLDANKDPLTILDAVEIAARELPNLHLWCCYHEQPLIDRVNARVSASAVLRDRVHLLGRVPHAKIEQLCRAADFFILGSHHEAAGYGLIEALSCGAMPVVSDIPPFRRLLGNVGVVAPVGNAAAFAEGLVEVASRPRKELRKRVLAHFATNLSWESVGRQLLGVYSALAKAS